MIGNLCTVLDCKKIRDGRLYCQMHATRLRRNGDVNYLKNDPKHRLKGCLKSNGCIEFIGYRLEFGYGRLRFKGKKYLAHRMAWELAYGVIPKGLLVCHSCDNASCINLKHLFLATQKENVKDCMNKGRRVSPWISRKSPK